MKAMQQAQQEPALACVADAIPPLRRQAHFQLGHELFSRRRLARRDLASGVCYRFASDDFADVARFLDDERKCCPFLGIELQLPPDASAFVLRLTGPAGTRELLDAELGLQAADCDADVESCGCA